MDIERHDGTKERREFDTAAEMAAAAAALVNNPNVKKITLHLPQPKLTIPRKRNRK